MLKDRADAGSKLMAKLPSLDPSETIVVALPRGGVPVAEVIADELGASLDIVLVRKVGMPGQPELALAAVTDGPNPRVSINRDLAQAAKISDDEIWDMAQSQLAEIERRRDRYLGGRAPLPIEGKTVLLVDDGIATGATARAALRLLRAQKPRRLILVVPVAPASTLQELIADVDDVVCLSTPRPFVAVGSHYQHFDQVPDRVVAKALEGNAAKRVNGRDDRKHR